MLSANALTTADRLSAYLQITPPTGVQLTVMEGIINAVSNFILNYTGMTFKRGSYVEVYSTERGQFLKLNHKNIDDEATFILERRNSSLNDDTWETVDGNLYSVDFKEGTIQAMSNTYFNQSTKGYRVTYTAGYDFDNVSTFLGDTEAGDIELAVWMMGSDFWKNKKVNSNVKSERVGDYSVSYGDVKNVFFNNSGALAILDGYNDFFGVGAETPPQSI